MQVERGGERRRRKSERGRESGYTRGGGGVSVSAVAGAGRAWFGSEQVMTSAKLLKEVNSGAGTVGLDHYCLEILFNDLFVIISLIVNNY